MPQVDNSGRVQIERQSYEFRRKHFANPRELADYIDSANINYGGSRSNSTAQMLREPSTMYADQIDQYIKQVRADIEVPRQVWSQSVAGFFPNVPAYLAGEPESMWTRKTEFSDSVPVRIVCNVLPSGGCDQAELVQHGAAIAALAILLTERRPYVHITLYGDLSDNGPSLKRGSIVSWDLSMNPMVISEIATNLVNGKIGRNASFSGCYKLFPNIGGDWLLGHNPERRYCEDQVRIDLGAGPDDIIVPGLYLGSPTLGNPVEWIKSHLAHYYEQGEE